MDIVERDEPVAMLEELLAGAVTGRGRVALVSGAMGMGKSTLLQTFAERVVDLGALAVVATGSATERNLPMGVINQLFQDAPLPPSERSRVTDLLYEGARAASVTPAGDEIGPVDAQIIHALCTVLMELSERYPLTIVVDDVHHADRASLAFLSYLARRVRFAQMLTVFGCPESRPADSSLQSDLLRSPYSSRIRLSPLTESGVRALAAAHVGEASADRFAASWHTLSGGNPLLVRGLLEDHVSAGAGEGDELDGPVVGYGYGKAVVSCLQRGSSPKMLEVGRGLAVLPDADSLGQLLELDPYLLTQSIRELTVAGVVSLGTFRHPAARSAVLADMDSAELVRLHRRAASLAYARGASSRVIAEQLLAAGECGEPWAVSVLEDAARQALREGRVEPAVEFLKLAWQECTDEQQRGKIMTTLVRAEWRINPSMPAGYLSWLADSLHQGHLGDDDAVVLAKALLWHGSVSDAREVFAHLEGAQENQSTRTELAIAKPWLRCTFPSMLAHMPAPANTPVQAAVSTVAISRRLEAVSVLAGVLVNPGDGDIVGDVEGILRGSHLDEMSMDTVESALLALIYGGHVERAGPWCELFMDEAQSRRAPSRQARMAAARAEVSLRLGDLASAVEHARRALEIIPPTSWGVPVGAPLATLVEAATAMGDHDQVRDWLDVPVPEAMFESRYGLSYLYARGRYSLATGHAGIAMRDFRRCGELMSAWGMDAPGLAPWRIGAAEACMATGRTDQAYQLAENQLARCGEQARVKGMGLKVFAAASLARHRPMLLRQASDLLQTCGDRYELASTLWALGDAYDTVGESRRASTIRRRAQGLAEECQAYLPGAGATGEEQSGAEAPENTVPVGPAALLSEAERRVAALAAVGYTNREIAEKLYLTISTVEQHLTRIYRKLEVRSRTELPSDLDVIGAGHHI